MSSLFSRHWIFILSAGIFIACSPTAFISREAKKDLITSGDLQNAHVGIAIYDAGANKTLYSYQSNKYFVPASNTKLFTCYAAMKYLGDSLTGLFYTENDTAVYLVPAGDPSLLHKDFKEQPVIDFLQKVKKKIYITEANWKENGLGFGWSWDDYNSDYMAERSPLPVYGNLIKWVQEKDSSKKNTENGFDNPVSIYSIPEVNWKVRLNPETGTKSFSVKRSRDENIFFITEGNETKKEQEVPFVTNGLQSAIELLTDTIGKEIFISSKQQATNNKQQTIKSRPLDSMLRPMMHRSDNFFAEQSLLMVSQKLIGYMNDAKVIDTLLRSDLRDLPQKPRWVDGSGFSRYNLFSPQDFIWLLNKMKIEFGLQRLKEILPTGGTGTLNNFFKKDSGYIFAKTGTLSGHLALSGYLYTRKNKLLFFSVLVNNHNGSTLNIRCQAETLLTAIRNKF